MLFTSLCHHRAQPEQTRGCRTATWGGGDSTTSVIALNQPPVTGASPQEERWCIALGHFWPAAGLSNSQGCNDNNSIKTQTSLFSVALLETVLGLEQSWSCNSCLCFYWLLVNAEHSISAQRCWYRENLSCFCRDRAVLLSYWGQRKQISPQQQWTEGFWK